MRQIFTILTIVLSLSTVATAQISDDDFDWGVRLGLNYSSLGGADGGDYSVKTGGVIGLFTKHQLNNSFYLQPEINYTSKGVTDRVEIENYNYNFTLAFTYIEVPVLVKFDFGHDVRDSFKPELFVGPFAAIKLNSELTLDEDQNGHAIKIEDVKPFDYGFTFGGGLSTLIDNVDVFFELRYTYSIPSYDKSSENLDVNHRVLTISVGMFIN